MAFATQETPFPGRLRLDPAAAGEPDAGPEERALAALDVGDLDGTLQILMDAYGTALFRYCSSLVSNPALAEEAHQLTFVQAFESLPSFGRRSTLRCWLFSIARHRCLDEARTYRRRERRFRLVANPPERPHPHPTADQNFLARDRLRALRSCLEGLPERTRDALLLRYQQALSYVEMERLGGDRAATLQARVARAMPKLRACLEERGIRW